MPGLLKERLLRIPRLKDSQLINFRGLFKTDKGEVLGHTFKTVNRKPGVLDFGEAILHIKEKMIILEGCILDDFGYEISVDCLRCGVIPVNRGDTIHLSWKLNHPEKSDAKHLFLNDVLVPENATCRRIIG